MIAKMLVAIGIILGAASAGAQPAPQTPPPAEDCGCGVPASPRGPR